MNNHLYNAAFTRLRAQAMESLAVMDILLNNPTMVADHAGVVDEIVKHAQRLVQCEGAMHTLQQYFQPASPSPTTQGAPPPRGEPITEKELAKTSTTFRKAKTTRRKKKKEEDENV